jgi:hypothetical protein
MPDVAGYELEVVIESGGRDLQIGVGEDVAALLEEARKVFIGESGEPCSRWPRT